MLKRNVGLALLILGGYVWLWLLGIAPPYVGCPVPQAARRLVSKERLEKASAALLSLHDKVGDYPNSGVGLVALGPVLKGFDSQFRDLPKQLDGWSRQPYYWSNGQHFVVISSGKDGLLDLNYAQLLVAIDLQGSSAFCNQAGSARRDDMILVDGGDCAGTVDSRGHEAHGKRDI